MIEAHTHADPRTLLSREIDELLLHLRGLVLVRDLLAMRGATRTEIEGHSSEIERRQRQLADLIGGRIPTSGDALGEAA